LVEKSKEQINLVEKSKEQIKRLRNQSKNSDLYIRTLGAVYSLLIIK
jgi:hypothetical protein